LNGDDSGSAALGKIFVTMRTRNGRALSSSLGPAEILKDVNSELAADDESEIFVTASCLKLDPTTRTLRMANAGHIPLIVRRTSGEVFTFGPPSGTPLGMLPCEYDEEELALGPLDIVLLMTDGLVEALDRPSDRMGLQLLLGLIKYAPHDPRLIHARILEAVQKMKGAKLLDDCTLVALQLEP
jgi:sigma-B regulation protein RsbU (phosphoserine phosphatase)